MMKAMARRLAALWAAMPWRGALARREEAVRQDAEAHLRSLRGTLTVSTDDDGHTVRMDLPSSTATVPVAVTAGSPPWPVLVPRPDPEPLLPLEAEAMMSVRAREYGEAALSGASALEGTATVLPGIPDLLFPPYDWEGVLARAAAPGTLRVEADPSLPPGTLRMQGGLTVTGLAPVESQPPLGELVIPGPPVPWQPGDQKDPPTAAQRVIEAAGESLGEYLSGMPAYPDEQL